MARCRWINATTPALAAIGLLAGVAVAQIPPPGAANGTLKGHVVDAAGVAVANCPVKIFWRPGNPGAQKAVVAGTATTDVRGDFVIAQLLNPGDYRWLAGNRRMGLAGGAIVIVAGQQANLEIMLHPPADR